MATLDAFRCSFFEDLLRPPGEAKTSALASQPGFAVYRNTVMTGCIDALVANYPTVHRLLGDAWFRDVARAFVHASLPCDGVLASYGIGFAAFLEAVVAKAELPYLAGVASLDRCWTEAHLAADAPVLRAADFAALTPAQLASGRLVPHPAARWLTFTTVPAYTVWRRHREGLAPGEDLEWRGEHALMARPGMTVTWRAIDGAAAAFLSACAAGATFGATLDGEPSGDDTAAWLPALMQAGAFSRIVVDDGL